MNQLKAARRSGMGTKLLRMLMIICSLGVEWKDPAKIPVLEIIDIWRSQSTKNRYEGNIWKAHMLAKDFGSSTGGDGGGGTGSDNETEKDGNVDAMDDSGYFARFEEPQPQHRGVNAGVHLGTRQM